MEGVRGGEEGEQEGKGGRREKKKRADEDEIFISPGGSVSIPS